MSDLNITVIGNLTGRPEVRYTAQGIAVANLTIAHNTRVFDKRANDWADGPTTFIRCSVWREQAEEVATLEKGARVIATGVLSQRDWEDRESGAKRSSLELTVDEIGESMKFARKGRVSVDQAWEPEPVAAGGQYGDETPF